MKLDETGEILVRGANVAAGYWQGKELKPALNEDGWFHTGDLGELDEEGNLYFKGRKKNVIVTREGMNVFPRIWKPRCASSLTCATAWWFAERGGNAEPLAVLLLRDAADPERVVKQANQHLAEFQQMRRWFVWPDQDFPRTATLKPKIAVIQRVAQEALASGAATELPQDALAGLLARISGRNIGALFLRTPNWRATSTLVRWIGLS